MKHDYSDMALDKDGIPILTDLVPEEKMESAPVDRQPTPPPPPPPIRSPEDIARELLNSGMVQQQLDQMASELAQDVRLQIEQTLAEAVDEAVKRTLDKHTDIASQHIRRQLDTALPVLIARALLDAELHN
ncbi:MAG: hypothetical protein KJO66_04355 [Gammaproteobacteria bacterium]|nr:hypothetical protein [Gammaproteobacteria bacterium]